MESLVVYDSTFGNTKNVAEAIADGLRSHGPVRLIGLDKLLPRDLGKVDLLFVGGPTQARGIGTPLQRFLDALATRPGSGMVAATFDARYRLPMTSSASTAEAIARGLRGVGVRIFAPPGSFFVGRRGRKPETGETERARTWAKNIADCLALSHWCAA